MLTAPYVHLNKKQYVDTKRNDNTISMIDYTNLYIKNLDSNVTSYDLFKRFRIFGKIISARVMKDTMTGISKGYGFVSFTHMEEAQEALQQMNGALINSKNIIVTFHTHKKPLKKYNTDYINLSPPITSNHIIYPSQPSPPYTNTTSTPIPDANTIYAKTTVTTTPVHNPWNETGIWSNNNAVLDTNTIQIQKLREAILTQLNQDQKKDLEDIVDLIQSLKKRELSLCLFNPSFLKQKINEAYEALYLFQNLNSNNNNITSILNSLEGLTTNKKKRVFGDIFYPHVKDTGIKRASSVTIRLLDTVPIEELVVKMYDKQELSKLAQLAYDELKKV